MNAISTQKTNDLSIMEKSLGHPSCDIIIQEPTAIITLQESHTPQKKRAKMRERLTLIEERLRDLQNAKSPANALAQINKKFEALRKKYNISSDIDPRSLMGPIERKNYDRERLKELQLAHKEEIRMMQKKLNEEKENLGRMKRKLASKNKRNKRRIQS
jgi:hypothetical protein